MIWNGDGPGQDQGPLRPDDVAPRQDAEDVPRVRGPVNRSVESGHTGMLRGEFRLHTKFDGFLPQGLRILTGSSFSKISWV